MSAGATTQPQTSGRIEAKGQVPAAARAVDKVDGASAAAALGLLRLEREIRSLDSLDELHSLAANETPKFTRARQVFVVELPAADGPRVQAVTSIAEIDRYVPLLQAVEHIVGELVASGRYTASAELGHAWTAVRYGCRVPSLGVAFMLLTPMLYTDVSAASALQNRRQRLAIGAAGVIVELAIAAIATLAWSFLPDGPLRSVAFMLLRVTAVTGGTVGAAQSLTYGALTVHADGSWLFAPNAAANALKAGDIRTEVVTYTVTDGTHVKTATLSIEIRGVNDAPTLVDPVTGLAPTDPNAVIARQTVADGSSITIPTAQAFADTDGGDTRTYMLTGAPAWLAIDPVNGLITTIGSVPADASQSGPYPLTVTMRDGSNAEVATSFVLDVTNPAPVAVADTSRDGENATQTGGLLANDDVAAWRS